MKLLRKLVRNGNSTQVSIPRELLEHLRWRAGDPIVLELTNADQITVRPPRVEDLRSRSMPMMLDATLPGIVP